MVIMEKVKPTAPVIVARLSEEFSGGRLALLYKCTEPYECYTEDGEEIPYSAIDDWQEVTI